MPTLILLRHGRSTANTTGVLAGRTPGVGLDERGLAQAAGLPQRLEGIPLALVVSSPLQRCQETVAPLLEARPGLELHTEDRLNECDYGEWSGRKLAELKDEPLMETVQQHPTAAAFPGGEALAQMASRASDAVRDWNARVTRDHGDDAVYALCSHGDVIKSLIADALGLHLDLFQRIAVDPCSVTVIRYTRLRPFLVRLGDTGDLASIAPRPPAEGHGETTGGTGDAEVGGGAGAP
ncbi:histidine phosphatase family protein [Streptomyces odontomachi]|uniref:histidine phosphatase family protein n=1 Tax=Streptomyces odontomachi TaxID=2944940 RepID=UPI00210A8B92|nr:histidine phosphatase family protein [Streptomyces sp. ODS25]